MPDEVAEQGSRYIFDNAGQPTADRFSGLASVFDPGSFRQLAGLGCGQAGSAWKWEAVVAL